MKQPLRTAQAGIAHLMLLVVVLAVAGAGGAGYYVWTKQKTNKVVSQLAPAAREFNKECVDIIKEKDLCVFAASWSLNGNYTFSMSIDAKDNKNSGMMVMSSDSSGNTRLVGKDKKGTVISDMITLDKVTYIYNPADKSWLKYDAGSTEETDAVGEVKDELIVTMEDIKDKKYQYKNLGKETCGSLTCFKYQIIDTTKPTEELIIWFDDAEYKARKFSFKDATQTMTADITYDAVTIGKPSPVKETPDYENMSEAELQKQLQELMKQYGQ